MTRQRPPRRRCKRVRRIKGYYFVPNTHIVLVVEDGKIVTVKLLEWLR